MSIRVFGAASLIAYSAVGVFAQQRPEEPEPVPSIAKLSQPANQGTTNVAAGTAGVVATCPDCTGLIASTGNLYFTSRNIEEFAPDSASFYRASKSAAPGGEILLYRETGDRVESFGKPVFAYVGGVYYGYFAVTYDDFGTRTSQIKRVPLAGGDAAILAYAPAPIGGGDFLTDGSRLYWADATGIRSLPIGGGAIQTLVAIHGTGRFHIAVDANYLYYALGNHIRWLPKTGGPGNALTTTPNVVTALYLDTPSATIFWGEEGGSVKSLNVFGLLTHQDPYPGRDITSVGFDGIHVMWIECTSPSANYCYVKTKIGGGPVITVSGGGYAARNLQWDASGMYWSNLTYISRYTH